ncbi:tetratricopeptide repeat protein [Jannaschia sp. W003]|uniref:tetratricopeptide repeat protein n=1 Tax=Jannaschia sp. W003 TaxID=2867012 RepID=UPI0021A86553|nr:tetratricopeptide repeat protein [Jannaschia sp. W003]UWQ20113.1 tetratricopeptide repeat protein [Jannaschia sp. W003]
MAALVLHLTGPFRITRSDGAPPCSLSRRGRAMLAFLACQPGMRAERGLIADLLWSDRSEAQARASLRQELSVLRRQVPEGVIAADRLEIWLDPALVVVEADADAEFLQGFDLPSEGFEDWLRMERAERSGQGARGEAAGGGPAACAALEQPALAVMPFEELGADRGDMFADGIVEEITGALSRIRTFHVVARQSAWATPWRERSAPELAQLLGVDYLIEGSVRRAGRRVRIAVQLVRAADGHTLWSERFDDELDDLFDLQDRISVQVAGRLAPNLRTAEIARARRHAPGERSAYELTLIALPHFWVHDSDENDRAIALLDAALSKAPSFGPARAQRAWCFAHRCCYLWMRDAASARAAARRDFDEALPLVDDHAPALTALSATAALALRDFASSEDLARRALDIDPNNAWGWLRLGWVLCYLGRNDEALACFDRAEMLSPLDPFLFNIAFGRSACLRSMKDYDGAVAQIHKGMRMAPKAVWAYRMLFGTLWLQGDREGAIAAGRKWRAAHPWLSRETLLEGLPSWDHDPEYLDLLTRFDELIPDG